MGCDPSQGFYKKIFSPAQNGSTRDIILESEGISKMAFSHFKQGRLEPINFDLIQCNDLDL